MEALRVAGSGGYSPEILLDADKRIVAEFMEQNILNKAVGAENMTARLRLLEANAGKEFSAAELIEKLDQPLTKIEETQLYFADLNNLLAFDPEETVAAVGVVAKVYPHRKFYALPNADALPAKIRNDAVNKGKNPNDIRAAFTPDGIYINCAKVRPSEVVRIVRNHELIWHDGIRRLLTPERRTELFNIVRADVPDEIEEFALQNGYDPESERAVEEFMAPRMEFEGNDPLKLFAENPDIAEFARESGIDTSTDAGKIKATERYYDETGEQLPRVPWYEKVIAWFRDLLRSLKSSAIAHFTDADYRRLFRKLAKVEKAKRQMRAKNTADDESRFATSIDPRKYYQIPFAEGLKRAIDPLQKNNWSPVFVSETPEIFHKIGFPRLPMMMNARKARLNYYNKQEFVKYIGPIHWDENTHGLHLDMYKLPGALANPVAIIANVGQQAQPNSVMVITDIDVHGKKVVIPVVVSTESMGGGEQIDAHLVLTVYDKNDWVDNVLKPALKKEKNGIGVFYFDKEKAKRYTAFSQFERSHTSGLFHNIAEAGIKVKPQNETLQFKQWFGDSKVVEKDGKTPLVVYHGSWRTFTEFNSPNGTIWATDNRDIAASYGRSWYGISDGKNPPDIHDVDFTKTDGGIYPLYMRIKNPLIVDFQGKLALEGINGKNVNDYAKEAKEQGHDGCIFRNVRDAGATDLKADEIPTANVYVAFSSKQCKLANGDNIGTFDPDNPDIRYSVEFTGGEQILDEYADFSDEAREKLVNAAKDWAAKNYLNASDADCLKFFQENNLPVKSERAAHSLMHEAYRLVQIDRAKRNARKAMDSYRENHPLFDFVMDFVGENTYVNPGKRFEGLEGKKHLTATEWKTLTGTDCISLMMNT